MNPLLQNAADKLIREIFAVQHFWIHSKEHRAGIQYNEQE